MTWTKYDLRLFATIARHCREEEPVIMTVTARLSAVLHAQGFRQGPPASLSPYAEAIDRAACNETACPECLNLTGDWVGLGYRPWHHPATGSYRALACCRKCGFSEEV